MAKRYPVVCCPMTGNAQGIADAVVAAVNTDREKDCARSRRNGTAAALHAWFEAITRGESSIDPVRRNPWGCGMLVARGSDLCHRGAPHSSEWASAAHGLIGGASPWAGTAP